MMLFHWLFYDFKYESWSMRIAAILLFLYLLFLAVVLGVAATALLTMIITL